MLDLTTDNTTLDLNGHTITATEDFYSTFPNDAHLLQVNGAENVVIKNGSLVSTDLNKHTVNVYQSQNVTLDGLTIDNTHTMGGCPVVVNASSVNVEDDLALVVGEKSWEGINVDPKESTAELTFATGSSVAMSGNDEIPVVKVDGEQSNITISGAEDAGLDVDSDGNFVPHTHGVCPELEQR